MKYIVPTLSGFLMFLMVFPLAGIVLAIICPCSWQKGIYTFGCLTCNIPSLLALALAALSARHTFKASLKTKKSQAE